MEIYSHPDIPEILSIDGNSICCDCGAQKPKWASLNNGTFLCLKCAGIHRSYGLNISLIRSLQIDSWTDEQILYLSKGGNNRFKMNLIEFQIDQNIPNEKKYKSKAADYYRKYLKNEVEKTYNKNYIPIEITKPNISEGKELINIKENEKNNNNQSQQTNKSFFGIMGNFFNTVKDKTVQTVNNVSKGIDDLGIKDKLKAAGDTVVLMAKTGGTYIADKTQEAYNSDLVQNIAKSAESGFNNVVEKTKGLINNKNKNGQIENGEMSSLVVNNNNNANNNNVNNNINDNLENNSNINANAEDNKNNVNAEDNKNNVNEEKNNLNDNIENKDDNKKEEQQPVEEEKKEVLS